MSLFYRAGAPSSLAQISKFSIPAHLSNQIEQQYNFMLLINET